jgi:hypothetical protein
MASLLPGYNYDIFISYRQKKNEGERARRGEGEKKKKKQEKKTRYKNKTTAKLKDNYKPLTCLASS